MAPTSAALVIGVLQGMQVALLWCLTAAYLANPRKRAYPASLFTLFVVMLTVAYTDYFLSAFYRYDMDELEGTPLCYFQGLLLTFATNSSALWGMCTAINLYLTVVREQPRTERLHKWYHAIAWGIPTIQTMLMLSVDVGPLAMWCWVQNPPYMRIFVLYIVFLFGGIIVTYCSVRTIRRLMAQKRDFQNKRKARKYAAMVKMTVFLICYGGLVAMTSLARAPTFLKAELTESDLREMGTAEYASAFFAGIIALVFGPNEENAKYFCALVTGTLDQIEESRTTGTGSRGTSTGAGSLTKSRS